MFKILGCTYTNFESVTYFVEHVAFLYVFVGHDIYELFCQHGKLSRGQMNVGNCEKILIQHLLSFVCKSKSGTGV